MPRNPLLRNLVKFVLVAFLPAMLAALPLLPHAASDDLGERDAYAFAYIGQRLLHGDALYRDLWDHKPPGIHLAASLVIALFGEDFRALNLFAFGYEFVGGLLFAFLCYTVFDGYLPALLGGAFLLMLRARHMAPSHMTETYLLLPVLMSLLAGLSWKSRSPLSKGSPWAAGVFAGLASTFRPTGLLECLFPRVTRFDLRALAKFAAGASLVALLQCGYFFVAGDLGDFLDAVFSFNLRPRHLSANPLNWDRLGTWGRFVTPLWLFAVAGLLFLWKLAKETPPKRSDEIFPFIPLWLVAALVSVFVKVRPHYHYFAILAAPVVLACFVPAYYFHAHRKKWAESLCLALLAVLLWRESPVHPIQNLKECWAAVRSATRSGPDRFLEGLPGDLPGSVLFASEIESPELFARSRARSATRFFYDNAFNYAVKRPRYREKTYREILGREPKYLFLRTPPPPRSELLPELSDYFDRNYRFLGPWDRSYVYERKANALQRDPHPSGRRRPPLP